MAETKFIAVVLVCVVLSIGVIGAIMVLNQKNIELQIKANQISRLENEKLTLEAQVSTLQNETLTLETQVANLQSETTSLNNEVSTLEAQVSGLQSYVTSLESEVSQSFNLGYVEGESDGCQLGYDEGYLHGVDDVSESGWYFRDPTYDEAIAFIDSDETDENEYTNDYVCYDFTADFNGNASQAGYRCGFAYIEFFNGAHAITCFNTTDRGLIYIEPQTDEIVTVAIGQSYSGHIIVNLGIIW